MTQYVKGGHTKTTTKLGKGVSQVHANFRKAKKSKGGIDPNDLAMGIVVALLFGLGWLGIQIYETVNPFLTWIASYF